MAGKKGMYAWSHKPDTYRARKPLINETRSGLHVKA